MGRPQWSADERYATHAARGQNQAELDKLIGEWTVAQDSGALLARLHEAGVPAGRI